MEVAKTIANGTYDITLRGSFTFNDHITFRDVIQQMSAPEVQDVVLHMALVDFIDSAALGMLLLALDETEKHHKKLVIDGAGGQVRRMFEMARFDTLFSMT